MVSLDGLARTFVREGWIAPSVVWDPSNYGGAYTAKWLPLWSEPKLQERLEQADLEKLNDLVDRYVRERITPEVQQASWQALRPRYGVPNTPLEKWVNGLLYDGDRKQEVADWFAEDVLAWVNDIRERLSVSPFRLAFVLLEPGVENEAWMLVPGLQALDVEQLFIPAQNVWSKPERDIVFAGRKFVQASEKLDAALAKAAAKLPVIERIRADKPWIELTTPEAIDFLDSGAADLEAEGFGVILPPWWEEPAPLEASVAFQRQRTGQPADIESEFIPGGPSALGFETLISYRKELLLHGAHISEEDWRKLVEREDPIFTFNGRWVRLREKDKRAAERFFRDRNSGTVTAAEALQTVLSLDENGNGAADETSDIPLVHWSGEEWLERTVMHLRNADRSLLPAPEQLQGELRDYQQRGYSWLVRMRSLGFGACLADDMGLGKTIQWIAYALYVREKENSGQKLPFLLLCPTSVLGNWQRELERFAPSMRTYLHYGPNRSKDDEFRANAFAHDIVLTSYSTAQRDAPLFIPMEWEAVTLDEAQYIKNSNTKLAHMIYRLKSRHRIAMTGTPLENRMSDLWSIFAFLNPGYLGSEKSFRRMYGGSDSSSEPIGESIQRLHRLIQPFLMRRMKTDRSVIQDLPEKMEKVSYCGLTERQAALYAAVLTRMENQLHQADGMKRRGLILSAITRLKQICNAPEHALRETSLTPGTSGKLNRLEELLSGALTNHEKAIVFTQYAYMAKLLQPYLAARFQCEVGMIVGATPRKEREETVRRFQEEENGPRILVLTLKTGGFGLNLTRANLLIHYDRWWNPAAERQATDRAYRIGQTRNVAVWKLVTRGTLEERVEQLLEQKEKLADSIVVSGETWITEYSDEQLKELLSLRRDSQYDEE